jgi:hypothetical protein
MWVLLASSFLAVLAFLFRSFIIHTDEGAVTVSALDLLSRSNSNILSDPKYTILKIAILIGISLGIVNVSMSLWQAGYTNARNMKLVNNLRFVITGFSLIVLVFLSGAMSNGTVLVSETFFGAFGINIVIYFIAYGVNLYYGVRERVSIINYKAICALMPIVFYTFWTLDFLTVEGIHISGINAIYFVNIPGLTYGVLEEAVRGSTLYAVLSQGFLFLYLYNLVVNFVLVILNKCYRRLSLNRYILSAVYSVAFGLFCVYVQGSTFEGSMGIFLIALMYAFLSIYTIAAYGLLKRGVYEGKEEIIDNDEDRYFDDQTGFISAIEDDSNSEGDSGLVYIKDGKRGIAPGIKTEEQNKVNYAVKREVASIQTDKAPAPQPKPIEAPQVKPAAVAPKTEIAPAFVAKSNMVPVIDKPAPVSLNEVKKLSKYGLAPSSFIAGEDAALEDEAKLKYDPSLEEYAQKEIIIDKQEMPVIIKLNDEPKENAGARADVTTIENSTDVILPPSISEEEEEENTEMAAYFNSEELFIKEMPEEEESETEEKASEAEDIEVIDGSESKEDNSLEDISEIEEADSEDNEEAELSIIEEDAETVIDEEQEEEEFEFESDEDDEEEIDDEDESEIEDSEDEDLEDNDEDEDDENDEDYESEDESEDEEEIEKEIEQEIEQEIEEEIEEVDYKEQTLEKTEESSAQALPEVSVVELESTEKVSGADGAQSYYKTLALINEDSEAEEIKSFAEVRRKNIAEKSPAEEQNEIVERLVTEDFRPEGVITVSDDHFYMMMPYRMKKEFTEVYMNPNEYIIRRIPQYVIGGDNSEFFASVLKYIDVSGKTISSDLILLLYEYVISLYSEDTEYISNCNRKVLDALHHREDREKTAADITEEVCIKEIKLTIKTDLTRTMPVIKRLILIYMRKKKYDEALQLCETAIRLNFTDNTVGGYEGRRRRIIRMMEKERG